MSNYSLNAVPTHIAFIIDGNGRWAKRRGLSRSLGHKAGFNNLKKIVKLCFEIGIRYVSIYAFSTENWNRPEKEIEGLKEIFLQYFNADKFIEDYPDVKVNIMGEYSKFGEDFKAIADDVIARTNDRDKYILNVGVNYSGKDEIVYAVNRMIGDGVTRVDRSTIDNYIYTSGQPEPDLIIRTSGEQRLSNFMLWQCAYSELYFPKTLWPDFKKKELLKALDVYSKRNRRFGQIKEEE
ncbi:MAG: di-trans,poly-cis-decaprenylcistransferase [Clostridiales bacterium]|nr:di-trans,poly-cis-decaprenylcistransferase [Clostridiales bacterium]